MLNDWYRCQDKDSERNQGTRMLVLTNNQGDVISCGELSLPATSWADSETWEKEDTDILTLQNFAGLNKELVQAQSKMEEHYKRLGQAPIADVFGQPIQNLTFQDVFVDLCLVYSSEVEKEWRERSEYLEHVSLHNRERPWKTTELNQIVPENVKYVLLDGIAGMGKTVISNYHAGLSMVYTLRRPSLIRNRRSHCYALDPIYSEGDLVTFRTVSRIIV